MDHKNLEYFMIAKKLNHRQVQWLLYLARFNFKLHHCPSHSIGKFDILSQRLDHGTRSHNNKNVVLIKPEFLVVQVLEGVVVEGEEKTLLRDIC